MKINELYVRRASKILMDTEYNQVSAGNHYVASLVKNIEAFGYTFDKNVLDVLKNYSVQQLEDFYSEMREILFPLTGFSKRKYKPMYPNFPQQVMEMDESELYLNALMHYFGDVIGVRIIPEYEEKNRYPLLEKCKLTVIGLGSKDDLNKLFENLIKSNTSISESDKQDIKDLILYEPSNLKNIISIVDQMQHKENKAFVDAIIYNQYQLAPTVKTATDVLRFAVALSDGDVSLATPAKFKKFKRSERRLILKLVQDIEHDIEEDINRYKMEWIKLGEIIHPGEKYNKTNFPKVFKGFQKLWKGQKFKTFNNELEWLIDGKYIIDAVLHLVKRPGEFARRLDSLVRNTHDKTEIKLIINKFNTVAKQISTPVLLQVKNHFENRNSTQDYRMIFPKGNVSKGFALENKLPQIDEKVCKAIAIICGDALMKKFVDLGFLGYVYIDPILKNYNVPFSQRSASKALKTIVRGSKIDLPKDKDTVRFFLWWKDMDDGKRVDIDLSVVMFDKDWNKTSHVSYTNLRSGGYGYHSGDITSAPEGASEFIDIDMVKAAEKGIRYVAMNVYSFTHQKFIDIPEACGGWMMRERPNSGEIYEPKTVMQKFDLTNETVNCIPAIIDIIERKVIWCDLGFAKNPYFPNCLEGNLKSSTMLCKSVAETNKPNLYDLLELHGRARGYLTDSKEDANTVFDESFASEFEDIVGNYLK